MILGLLTVVLLIGSAIFGAFNIARPLRALVRSAAAHGERGGG